MDDVERFWSNVDRSGECWIWMRSVDDWGYGTAWFRKGNRKAHRVSYELEVGPIPVGMKLLHSCDTPACVRPDHLRPGTHTENMADMYAKGRGRKARGEAHPQAKLTDDIVREIRRRYGAGEKQIPLATEYGVAQGIISQVVRRESWSHVQDLEMADAR